MHQKSPTAPVSYFYILNRALYRCCLPQQTVPFVHFNRDAEHGRVPWKLEEIPKETLEWTVEVIG